MREVACAHHVYALDLGPLVQGFQVQVFAGGAGVVGVDVQVGGVVHYLLFFEDISPCDFERFLALFTLSFFCLVSSLPEVFEAVDPLLQPSDKLFDRFLTCCFLLNFVFFFLVFSFNDLVAEDVDCALFPLVFVPFLPGTASLFEGFLLKLLCELERFRFLFFPDAFFLVGAVPVCCTSRCCSLLVDSPGGSIFGGAEFARCRILFVF